MILFSVNQSHPKYQKSNSIVVNFINTLRAAFVSIFFCQKITKPKLNLKRAVQSTFVQKGSSKMLMKLTVSISRLLV